MNNKNSVKNFTDLDAWQINYKLVKEIYVVIKDFPKYEFFGLTSQLRKSASSITANIAEGFGRFHYIDKTRFYFQARGSNTEVQNHLILARDLEYLSKDKFVQLNDLAIRGHKLICGLIRSTVDINSK